MKNVFIMFLLLATLKVFSQQEPIGEKVSLIDLTINPKKYYGKKIIVMGYLNLERESQGIFFNENDAKNHIFINGIGVKSVGLEYDSKYVVIAGIFEKSIIDEVVRKAMKKDGIKLSNYSLYVGYIKHITFVKTLEEWK